MLNDFSTGLDFLAALCTLVYIARLLVQSSQEQYALGIDAKKRSLLNQVVRSRA